MKETIESLTIWRGKFELSLHVYEDDTLNIMYDDSTCGCCYDPSSTHSIKIRELFEMIKHAHTLEDIRTTLLDRIQEQDIQIEELESRSNELAYENQKLRNAIETLKSIEK